MNTETEKLLSLIYQASGQIKIEDGQLLVFPPSIAQRFGDQIRRLKPEILLALGHCPGCGQVLTVKIEERTNLSDGRKRTLTHKYCSTAGHYDRWAI